MNPRIFREYDIRGVADRDLDDALVTTLGRALAARVARTTAGRRPQIALGRDCRLTSPRLRDALVAGLVTGAGAFGLGWQISTSRDPFPRVSTRSGEGALLARIRRFPGSWPHRKGP